MDLLLYLPRQLFGPVGIISEGVVDYIDIFDDIFLFFKLQLFFKDERTKDWFFIWNDPKAVLLSVIFYILFVIYGRKYMESRKAIHIPMSVMVVYNLGLVVLSAYMFYEVINII